MNTKECLLLLIPSIIWLVVSVITYLIPAIKNIDNKTEFIEALGLVALSFTPAPAILLCLLTILASPILVANGIYFAVRWLVGKFSK